MLMNRKSVIIKKNDQDEMIVDDVNNNLVNLTSSNSVKSINNSNNSLNQQQFIGYSKRDKSINDRFHQLFPTIPIYETVIQSYSCAYIKSINLYQGVMFLTSNYIGFYSKIFSYETILVFKWKDVTSINKINYALIFPTAIRIDTTQSSYAFTTFRSRTQTYDTLIDIWNNSLKKQNEISKAKPNDVIDYKLKLEKERQVEEDENIINSKNNKNSSRRNSNDSNKSYNSKSSSNHSSNISINNQNKYYCRANFDSNRDYIFYDLNFSQLSNKQTVTVSLRHKKSIIQKAKVLLGCLIPGFFNISRIDSLLPICFLMCVLLLLNAFVLLHKVNQVDELFSQLLKPL